MTHLRTWCLALIPLVGCYSGRPFEAEQGGEQGGEDVGGDVGGEIGDATDTDGSPGDAGGMCGEAPCPAASVSLPVEVFGRQASISFEIELSLEQAAATHLFVQCNACGYHDHDLDADPDLVKAGVRINQGPMRPIKRYSFGEGEAVVGNEEIVLSDSAAAYGGIGGGFRTVDMAIPLDGDDGLSPGVNTFTFEHLDDRPPSIGFRIIGFDLLSSSDFGDRLLEPQQLEHDDPAAWTAPPGATPQDVTAGHDLWYATDSLYDPFVDELDAQPGGAGELDGDIHAACAGCHAEDGRDLQYFNFSNHSIIERSIYHGLTAEEGGQIAAYIRSLDVPFAPLARPWNPPYQPGPGLDARPVHEWAAGAGLDAVLERDADMEAYLFDGDTDSDVAAVVDRFGTLNMRELPIALQLPEWNQWLPGIHPSDAFDTSHPDVLADYAGNPIDQPYFDELWQVAQSNPNAETIADLQGRFFRWLNRGGTCFTQVADGGGVGWRATNSHVAHALALPGPSVEFGIDIPTCYQVRFDPETAWAFELAKFGLVSWSTVKQWELMHRNDLETAGSTITDPVCTADQCVDASEPRGWVSGFDGRRGRNVFTRAPHYVAYNSKEGLHQHPVVGRYDSTAWYHLQMVLNPGYRVKQPSHFIYTMELAEALHDLSGESQSYRFWAGMIKMRQLQTNGVYGKENGLDLRTAQPFWLWSDQKGDTSLQAGVGAERWRQLAQAVLRDFVADAQHATWAADWSQASNNSTIQSPESTDFDPCPTCFQSLDEPRPFTNGATQGRNTLRVIPKLAEIGVSSETLDELVAWCESMWPEADWSAALP